MKNLQRQRGVKKYTSVILGNQLIPSERDAAGELPPSPTSAGH